MEEKDSLQVFFCKAVLQENRKKMISGAVLICCWFTMSVLGIKGNFYWLFPALMTGFAGVWLLFSGYSNRIPEKQPLHDLIFLNKENIVWVYSTLTHLMPFGIRLKESSVFVFKTIDRNEYSLEVRKQDADTMLSLLKTHLSHASFGYTKDKEQWYLADPTMLFKH